MLRKRYILFYTTSFICVCIIFLSFLLLSRKSSTSDSVRMVSEIFLKTTKPAPQTTPPAPQTSPPAPQTTPPAPQTTPPAPQTTPPAPQTTPPALTPFPSLPHLTLEAQDSYYGPGCKENRYRKRLQKVLQEWGLLAERRNITQYFLCFGSFLGAVRNGDIVPYDSDLDVCMFRRDYHKLYPEESNRPVNLNDGRIHLLLQRHSPHPLKNTPRKDCKGNIVRKVVDHCAILDPHGRFYNGALIYMDIFMLEDHGAQFWDEYRDKIHHRNTILPIKPCKYLGLDTKCPNDNEEYLKMYYGNNYMVPHHKCNNGKWEENMVGARPRRV